MGQNISIKYKKWYEKHEKDKQSVRRIKAAVLAQC